MKYDEKQKQEAAKEARNAAREAKKLQTMKLAVEKLILKNKKIDEVKKAAEIKSAALRTQKVTQKRKQVKNCNSCITYCKKSRCLPLNCWK